MDTILIDLKALMVEREDCDAGTVEKLRTALAQGKTQYRALRESAEALKKKVDAAAGSPLGKRWHLKLAISQYFIGHLGDAIENFKQAEGALANFYLGKALLEKQQPDEALKAFDKAEKAGYNSNQVKLQRAGIYRAQGDVAHARSVLKEVESQASHNPEYHFQTGCCFSEEGLHDKAVQHFEKAIELDPSHTGALFQLGHYNDLAGNDEDAISCYERCMNHPPIHVGLLMNLGILYEDSDKYDKAVDCYRRILHADPNHEQARLFFKDAEASLTMYYNPEAELASSRYNQVLEIPVTDFELSVRSRNCLKKMNIRTLGDLTRVSEPQLLSSKNFGETSLNEIKLILGAKSLRVGQALETSSGSERRFMPTQQLSEEEQMKLNRPVSDLNLSVRARKCMNRLGLATLGELVHRTADELLEAKNFGMTSLNEVREKLRQMGMNLRGD
ncbi:MAG: tetratricopeptide repeat protein [Planctomycetes bacterium]|nr:tetratricopeptide repeat protein [Planctomycetota bacterium]